MMANATHRLLGWWTAFSRLHFLLRKAIWLAFFMGLFGLTLWIRDKTGEKEITNYVAMIGAAGIIWASGVWYAFVGAWVIFRWSVRAFR
jgi:hypothetical protein